MARWMILEQFLQDCGFKIVSQGNNLFIISYKELIKFAYIKISNNSLIVKRAFPPPNHDSIIVYSGKLEDPNSLSNAKQSIISWFERDYFQ